MTQRQPDFFNDFFRSVIGLESLLNFQPKTASFPKFEILQNQEENKYLLRVLLAGYDKKDISVSIEKGFLIIEHAKKNEDETDPDDKTLNGFTYVSEKVIAQRAFRLQLRLTNNVELTEAKFDNGILSIYFQENVEQNKKTFDIL